MDSLEGEKAAVMKIHHGLTDEKTKRISFKNHGFYFRLENT